MPAGLRAAACQTLESDFRQEIDWPEEANNLLVVFERMPVGETVDIHPVADHSPAVGEHSLVVGNWALGILVAVGSQAVVVGRPAAVGSLVAGREAALGILA